MQNIDATTLLWYAGDGTTTTNYLDLSAAGTATKTVPIPINRFEQFSVMLQWQSAGSPVGTIQLMVSSWQTPALGVGLSGPKTDYYNGVAFVPGFVAVPGLLATLGTDSSPCELHMITNAASYMQLVWTRTSGGVGNILVAKSQGVTT